MTEKRNDWARVGVVIGSRGLKGEVLIKSFTAQPENIGVYGQVFDNVDRYFDIKVIGKKNKLVIACLSGVLNRKDADALKGVSLYVLKKMLPKNFYFNDNIGMKLGCIWSCLESCGLYVPGGKAYYPSSVIMNAIPAKIAGSSA